MACGGRQGTRDEVQGHCSNNHQYIGKTGCKWPVYVAPIADSMLLGCDIFDYMNMTLKSTQGLYLNGEWITCDTLRKCGMETPIQLLLYRILANAR